MTDTGAEPEKNNNGTLENLLASTASRPHPSKADLIQL